MHFVYILQSKQDKSIYVGITQNVQQRVIDHNAGKAKYSRTKRPYILKWFCAFPSKHMAAKLEKYLKQGSGFAFANKHLIAK